MIGDCPYFYVITIVMISLKSFLFVGFYLLCGSLAAQTPQAIEADLLRSFKKIGEWDTNQRTGVNGASDSLVKANEVFGKKLQQITERHLSTITQTFALLEKERLDISTSADGLFRIYSWDTWQGGTMHDFANVMQYRSGSGTASTLLVGLDGNNEPSYAKLYTFKSKGKTYYLGVYRTISSSKDAGMGIKVFAIENGKLNDAVKIIKTSTGLRNKLYYSYDFFSVVNIAFEKRPTITFDTATQTIRMPLVNANGKVTNKIITYKFNGQYFEKGKAN